jgi:hypothetical protein
MEVSDTDGFLRCCCLGYESLLFRDECANKLDLHATCSEADRDNAHRIRLVWTATFADLLAAVRTGVKVAGEICRLRPWGSR